MPVPSHFAYFVALMFSLHASCLGKSTFVSYDPLVGCDEDYKPKYCGLPNISLDLMYDVDDFDRCGPAALSKTRRNYFWAGAGRKVTYTANLKAYNKLAIVPKYMTDMSHHSLATMVLGQRIEFPIGVSPTAVHRLAHQDGEFATALAAVSRLGTVMIVSSMASISIEDLVKTVRESNPSRNPVFWIQSYPQKNRRSMLQLVRRAEKQGFRAIVITIDMQKTASVNCDSRDELLAQGIKFPNLESGMFSDASHLDPSASFEYLQWLKQNTYLPIVAKGILTGPAALMAVRAGVSGIMVSNHGGRQLDGVQATIDALPGVISALRHYPHIEIYLDGGIRHGQDVFKAIAIGARAVFVGRPIIWGLAIGGEEGVYKVLTILKKEFNETMLLAGGRYPGELDPSFVVKTSSCKESSSYNPASRWFSMFVRKR